MAKNRNSTYNPPALLKSNADKGAHFIYWCYQHRPGERIKYRELAQVIYGVSRVTEDHKRRIKSTISHISRRLWGEHSLGLDANDIGLKVVSDVHEYVKTDYMKRFKRFAAGKRAIDFGNKVVDSKKDEFKDTDEGRSLKRFYMKVRGASNSAQLPSANEVRGLLGETTQEDE